MSSNFLSLNHYKTEFLICSLPQQHSKLYNPTIHLPNYVILFLLILLVISLSSMIKICHLRNKSLLSVNRTFKIFVIWDVFVILWIKLLPALLLPIISTLLTIAILFYSLCLPLELIVFDFSSTLTAIKTPKFHHIIPILKSLLWLKIEIIKYQVL